MKLKKYLTKKNVIIFIIILLVICITALVIYLLNNTIIFKSTEDIKNDLTGIQNDISNKEENKDVIDNKLYKDDVGVSEETLYIKQNAPDKVKKSVEGTNIGLEKTTKSVLDLDYDKKLFEILRELRRKIADENNIPPFIVFTDVSLKEMSTYYPTTVENMLEISGVGVNKLEKYGEIFKETIQNYVVENNIAVPKIVKKAHSDSEKNKKISKDSTYLATYKLYQSGKTIAEIADERDLSHQTIENHLVKCYAMDLEIDLSKDLHQNFEKEIFEVIDEFGVNKLKILKENLPNEVSYFDIRYYIEKYKKIKK